MIPGVFSAQAAARSSALWTPARISTVFWLDAADASTITHVAGEVSEWRDKSGGNAHASQSTAERRPTVNAAALNSLDVLAFDADYMVSSFGVAQPDTFFIVARTDRTGGRSYVFDGQATTGRQLVALNGGVNGSNPSGEVSMWANSWLSSGTVNDTNWHQYSAIFTGGQSNLRQDATSLISGSVGGNSLSAITIGANWQGTVDPLNGDIAEIVVIDRVPTSGERERMEGYLAWKWGLQAGLPVGHPYKSAPPYV